MESTESGARIARAILREYMTESEMVSCLYFDKAHEFCDANIALYGAFAAIHFREPESASESDANWLNSVAARVFA
jgi:hypothetical protein